MNRRQRFALTHPLDEFHMRQRMASLRQRHSQPDGAVLTHILAVDR